jgi:hypothetical protein
MKISVFYILTLNCKCTYKSNSITLFGGQKNKINFDFLSGGMADVADPSEFIQKVTKNSKFEFHLKILELSEE